MSDPQKIRLSIKDLAFAHSPVSNGPTPAVTRSKHIEWDRETVDKDTIYTDACIINAPPNSRIWLIEPQENNRALYTHVQNHYKDYKEIWTHDRHLLTATDGRGKFVPLGGCWIAEPERWVWPKTHLLSTIASNKRGSPGANLRHEVIAKLGGLVDAYGVEYTPLPLKIGALRDYYFHIAIENARCDYWFTEKLLDCFATGTIPVYWGCPSISQFFDPDGIIPFTDLEDLEHALEVCTPDFYQSKIGAVRYNFERAKEYYLAEDYIFSSVLPK